VRGAGEGLRSGQGWLRRRLFEPDYPLIALEVRPHSLGVVRLFREGKRLLLGAAASLDLPEGALTLSMTQPNITDAAAFGKTLAGVVERAGALAGGEIGLVLPDPVVRLALLPAPEVTGRGRRETEDLIRFRLKKALPFEAREARVAPALRWLTRRSPRRRQVERRTADRGIPAAAGSLRAPGRRGRGTGRRAGRCRTGRPWPPPAA